MELIIVIISVLILIEVSYLVLSTKQLPSTTGRRKVFIDTSALMDGRIVTAAQTGFIPDNLVVPKSVVAELQLLADQADNEKRSRARRGLDAIKELQSIDGISVSILNDGPTGEGGVDARLVELAKKHTGKVCTIDFNLNKVAQVNKVPVLNINELAGSVRMAFLPGETMSLVLMQKGQGDDQAVGYLADGTMVVVDKAAKFVGTTVQVEFIRSLQTAAGRMMFAKLSKQNETSNSTPKKGLVKRNNEVKGRRSTSKNDTSLKEESTDQPDTSPRRRSKKSAADVREDSLIDLVNNQ